MLGRDVRVVHVYKDIYPPVVGGIERHIDTIRRTLGSGDVVACGRSLRTRKTITAWGRDVLVGELGRLLSVPLAPTFPLWLARQQADIVHLHMPNPTGELSALLACRDVSLVVSYHADIDRQAALGRFYRPLLNACLRRAKSILVSSRRILDSSPVLAPWRDKAEVVPYGIDLDRFDPSRVPRKSREQIRDRYGTPLIVSTGRLVYYKGFEQLIAASRGLDASVVIIGGGPLEGQLRALSRDLPRVHLTGRVSEPELLAYLAAADCFVLPSTSHAEAFGIATLEAQAMGVPAVVTDVGTATVEAIDPDKSGIVISPGSPVAIIEACSLVIENTELRSAMSAAARRHVSERHSLAALSERLRSVYANV